MRRRVLVPLAAALLASALPAWPQTRESEPAGMPVPGTVANLARAAGVDRPALPRWRVLHEIVRTVYAVKRTAPGTDAALARERFLAYLFAVGDYEARLAMLSGEGRISLRPGRQDASHSRLSEFLRAAGLRLDEAKSVARVEHADGPEAEARRSWLREAGLDVTALRDALNAGEECRARLASDSVPLPLRRDQWESVLGRQVPERALAPTILSDRNASLLYYGLSALDTGTCAFLARDMPLLRRFYERSGLCVFLEAIKIREGRVSVPGGPGTEKLWRELVAHPPSRPTDFIRELFSKDQGRLALFFDALARLDASRLSFALGVTEADDSARARRFAALYAASRPPLQNWSADAAPFRGAECGMSDVLSQVAVDGSGRLAGPSWPALWDAVFDGGSLPAPLPARGPRPRQPAPALDAARLLEHLLSPLKASARHDRLSTFLFAQRAFSGADESAASDLLVTLRGFTRYRVVPLTLERMGVRDPGLYARATRLAAGLSAMSSAERAAAAVTAFQAALALVERIRFARSIDAPGAARLVSSLVALPLGEDGQYRGHVAHWLEEVLLPAASAATGMDPAVEGKERVVLAAMAGVQPGARPPAVRWEDSVYRVDVAAAELTRLERITRQRRRNGLDAALRFSRAAASLAAGGGDAGSLRSRAAELAGAAGGLLPPRRVGLPQAAAAADPKAAADRAIEEVTDVGKDENARKAADVSAPLLELADLAVGEALASLAYASALGDPRTASLISARALERHAFTSPAMAGGPLNAAWQVPEQAPGIGGRGVTGSLLGLDVALASLSLHRIAERQPAPPTLSARDAAAIAQLVVLMNARDLLDADRDVIAAAIKRGRDRATRLAGDPAGSGRAAAAAGLEQWRANALGWLLANEADALPEFFSLAELFWLGIEGHPLPERLDAWGTSSVASGMLGLRFPQRGSPARWSAGVATAMPDLGLRVAEALSDERLPAPLAASVLASACQDFMDEASLLYPDDLLSAAAHARRLNSDLLADYISVATANGPLIPALEREPS